MNLSTLNPNELVGPSGRNVQSAYFDGTGDYLTAPSNAAFEIGTGQFTLELWLYFNTVTNLNEFVRTALEDANGRLMMYYASGGLSVGPYGGGAGGTSASWTPTSGQWYHIAGSRDGSNNQRLFVNGVLLATATSTVNYSQSGFGLFQRFANFSGYCTDVRLVKGTALYTAAFTPPTAPLTPIANTSFLLGFSEYRFIDQSPNNFTITRNGDTTQSTFGPYGGNWSNYFDGTGDDLSLTGQNLSATDWTVECWVYFQSFSNNAPHVWNFGADGNNRYNVWRNSATGKFSFARVNGGSFDIKNGTTSPVVGQWYHVAVVRVNSTGVQTLYVDGVAEVTNTGAISSGTTWTLGFVPGGAAADRMLGYISNFRVVTSALYTSNFTPPTAPLSSIPNTSLLTCQSNRFLDSSPNNFAITRNGDVSVQPYVPFAANWSNYFDGTGDYLRLSPGAAFAFGTGNFTVELWVFPIAQSASVGGGFYLIDARNASQTTSWLLGTNLAGTAGNAFLLGWSDGSADLISTGVLIQNNWNHVVYVRSGTTGSLFLNGGRVGTKTDTKNYNISPTQSTIGSRYDGILYPTNGYLSNIRIVNGTAVYDPTQTTLAVPTAPLTAITNTSLLTCQSNSFTDFSSNNFTITPNGNVSARFYGPFAGPVPEPVVDVYTNTASVNTWIKRPGAKAVQMIAIGAGGGGGGGMGSASGVQRNGGAGGGGGANGQIIYTADQLPSTLYIRVGASGTGGASNTSGGAGGNSTIAAADPIISSTSVYCMGGGGGGGEAGAASSSSVGGGGGGTAGAGTTGTGENAVSGGLPAVSAGFALGGGGAGGGSGAAGTTSYAAEWGGGGGGGVRSDGANRQPGGGSLYGGGGGGVGGFVNSAGGGADGFCGGASGRYLVTNDQANFGGGAAGTGANPGGAGANAANLYAAGSGGGGGSVSGFAGGAGGFPGGGGGGGGGSSTTTGGTGGVGGAGRVVLITFF